MDQFSEGCRCYELVWLNTRCLVLENDILRTTLLLDYGATVVEYRYKPLDFNLVWRTPLWKQNLYGRQRQQLDEAGISDHYLGGWFDIFPNYGAGCDANGVHYANHDELLYLPWRYEILEQKPDRLTIQLETWLSKQACHGEKTITIIQGSTQLECSVRMTNIGGKEIPYQWGFHPTLGAPFLSPDCEILLPAWEKISETQSMWMKPQDSMEQGLHTLNGILEGRCTVRNHAAGLDFCMKWDAKVFSCAQIWLSAGHNYGHHSHGGTYALCIVPTTTPQESLSSGICRILQPGESCSTRYSLSVRQNNMEG